jgi:prophage regulatory protein
MSPPITPKGLPPKGFIRIKNLVPGIVPVSAPTLWRWVAAGQFPKPVKLGSNTTAWACSSVQSWLDAKGSK